MKREKLLTLLFALIKNSKRSDRDLAKILGFSQPTVTRIRKALEKEAIKQYTIIPNLPYLGFDIIALTFSVRRSLCIPFGKKERNGRRNSPT
jgi:DNA-binding Lrp family transcriptional regulator